MQDCIFCKIAKKEILGHILYEDEQVLAFLDISQTTKGHTLIIPKQHSTDIFDTTPTTMEAVFAVTPRIANALKKTFKFDGLNMVNNSGVHAGQTVFHYHVHLIPRYALEDTFDIKFSNNMKEYSIEKLAELRELITSNLEVSESDEI